MKLLALDGNSILNRAYYGIRLLSTKDGIFTNGIYGFLTMFEKIKNDTNPDAVAITFDMRAPTFRHLKYDGYKAQRKGMPEELAMQMPILQELLEAMGYPILKIDGWEADDLLGTLAFKCTQTGDECIIATGDRDTLQLVGNGVSVRLLSTKQGKPDATLYDETVILEKYGVKPKQLIDIKAIQGDASDNIPGVKGIGEKGAGELIKKFGSLQYIYDNLDQIDIKQGVRDKLEASRENAFLSYWLGTVSLDAPISENPGDLIQKEMDKAKTASILRRLEMFSMLERMGLSKVEEVGFPITGINEKYEIIDDTDDFSLILDLKSDGEVFLTIFDQEDLKCSFTRKNEVYITDETAVIKSILEDANVAVTVHDSKKMHNILYKHGIEVNNVKMDTMLAAYLLNPNSTDYNITKLCSNYGVFVPEAESEILSQACALPALAEKLYSEIEKNEQKELLIDIEIPLARVLSSMEQIGVRVDSKGIEVFGKQLEYQLKNLENDIYSQSGQVFNINSPKQLGKVLFEDMGLKPPKKTKTGYSTSAEVLESLRSENIIIENILSYRQLSKLKSTYCDGLLKVIGKDGRIHTTFNQTETRTGRISSVEPNLQNIPVRTELGREMRKFFVADDGNVLCDADYSQIELRVLAHVANDPTMQKAFKNNEDIHSITAAQVFEVPLELVNSHMRSSAKAVNFGIVYGIGAFSLGKDIGVSTHEAAQYIKSYLKKYDGVRIYMEKTVEEAKRNGYAETIFARRRPLPEINASNGNIRAFGERVAMNMPIQGTAADIIKIAMIRVYHRLKEEKMRSCLVLQVHDELIIEAPFDESEMAARILKEEMENAVKLSVELTVDVNTGTTWYDAKE